MTHTTTDSGGAMPSHTTPTNEPQFKPPQFVAHVFFKVDGALDYHRDTFDDLDVAIDWAKQMYSLSDTPFSAIVYEQSAIEDEHGLYALVKRFEQRAENGGAQ